jgi:DNA-binding NarL/FixJ family response regulator
MKKISIAIVEDEVLVREGFKSILSSNPEFEVVLCAENGADFLDELKGLSDLPDIVIMDLNMPVLNGIDTTQRLLKIHPSMKVIALTSYNSHTFILNLIRMGAVAYVLKNEEPNVLIKAVKKVYENGFYHDEKILEVLRENAIHPNHTKKISFDNVIFSKREKEILQLICDQKSTQEIAEQLFISGRTVEGHRNNMLIKTGVRNTVGLVIYALKKKVVKSSIEF